ncbi:hypothetical protein LAZ67_21001121 [Cordylochernes scorpioides]|uniref:Integrase catalytic domain-containing protein n=1 Tax=Cordylochernes scorpioides TaxID=51811 RepID=A0ABY6LLV0_9ARAC|nr:hypothetical protein LAZ67_21001121 [Cordylochernes scorpioides]
MYAVSICYHPHILYICYIFINNTCKPLFVCKAKKVDIKIKLERVFCQLVAGTEGRKKANAQPMWGPQGLIIDDPCKQDRFWRGKCLTSKPILHLFKEGLPCQLFCDVSLQGIAGILEQQHPDGTLHPVQYYSRAIRPHEKNYSITELECLAVIDSVEKFRIYLAGCGRPKRLLSDRAPAFTSPKFRRFSVKHGIQPLLTTANNPQANGLCERLNATLTGKLRLLHLENPRTSWTKLIRILAVQRTNDRHAKEKIKYDNKHKTPQFAMGDLVLVKAYHHPDCGKLVPYITGPYKIIEIISDNVVRINRPNKIARSGSDTVHNEEAAITIQPHSSLPLTTRSEANIVKILISSMYIDVEQSTNSNTYSIVLEHNSAHFDS